MPSRVNRVLWSFFYPLLAFWIYLVPLSLYAATVPAGDVAPYGSADGQLNAADAVIIQRFIFGDLTPTANELLIGDVAPLGAPDGVLNAADMAILMRAIIGEILLDPVTVPPASPTLNGSDATTNTNPYIITGTAIPGIDVNLYINGQQQATTTASDGSFTFLAALFDGNNVIYVTAQDGAGESVPSDNILSIEYINIIPRTQSDPISTDTVWTPG
ncbi:MAG: Ig-like domain-containing protein, partial [Gammaproteobacteria bacterium]|nr:Ig-like domain-containing protein [Gammaproteobacteria bacterium]